MKGTEDNMYYGIVTIAVFMFGIQFFCSQGYQQECGSSWKATFINILATNLIGLPVLWAINDFSLQYTHFTFLLATITTVNNILCTVCSLRALGKANLSVYSLFSMLGGMVLPFCTGIFFFHETWTPGKVICLITVILALLLTIEKGKGNGAVKYYIGVFIFNGMAGVLSKFFQALPYEKTSEAAYSVWCALIAAGAAAVFLLFLQEHIHITGKSLFWLTGDGLLNKVANWLLLIALVHLPVSVQYPMVTGGVIIVSTLLSYLTPKKPGKREFVAVLLSFAGILALILL